MYKVTDEIYRSGRPSYIPGGFKTVISLENDESIVAQERIWCDNLGIKFINVPLSESARSLPSILIYIAHLMSTEMQPLLIHCKHGQDRTGYAVAAYRMMTQKWTFEKAWKECREYGHKWLFYFWWKQSLKEIARIYNAKR